MASVDPLGRVATPGPTTSRRFHVAALLLWLLPLIAVSIMVIRNPTDRSVTPVFQLAAQRWWAREPLYADVRGFHYLPQFALLFTPFHALPAPAGDVLWRAVSVGVLLFGVEALVRRLALARFGRFFFFVCLLSLAPCLGAVRNGQTNLAFGGLILLLAALLASSRWMAASICLAALVTVKPLGLVLLPLAAAVYPRVRKPAAIAMVVLIATPLLFAPSGYVIAEYRDAVHHLAGWASTSEHRFADLGSLLRAAGWEVPGTVAGGMRAVAGVATVLLTLAAVPHSQEPRRALTLVLLGAIYLMLFNPMTEKNSYAIVAPALAVGAVDSLSWKGSSRQGWFFAFVLVSIGAFPELFWRVDRNFGLWWDPLMMVAAGGLMTLKILRREEVFPNPAAE